jgi:hypothetical protein
MAMHHLHPALRREELDGGEENGGKQENLGR